MKKIFFIILLLIILCSLFAVHFALAGYKIEVALPGGPGAEEEVTLIEYVRYIYLFGLSLVGIAALGALVYGGFMYMLSGTITSKDEAKKYIWGAISGLVLALAAYLILNTINPDLVNWTLTLPEVEEEIEIVYQWTQVPMNQYCVDVLGNGWMNVNHSYCEGTAPGTDYECCKHSP